MARFTGIVTVHKNGSSNAVVIPKPVCKALRIERGDQLAVVTEPGGGITLRKLTKERIANLMGA